MPEPTDGQSHEQPHEPPHAQPTGPAAEPSAEAAVGAQAEARTEAAAERSPEPRAEPPAGPAEEPAEPLAETLAAAAGPGPRAVLADLRAVDGALYAAVAATPTPALDRGLRRLSHAADNSKISFAVAAALALAGGRARSAAIVGVGAIAVASASANLLGKRLVRRPRPDREAARVTVDRHVPMPTSASFPSGHTASAVAFATAVGVVFPPAAVPLTLLAWTVGYSRVHTGVHYPGDVAGGAALGLASAAVALAGAGAWSRRAEVG